MAHASRFTAASALVATLLITSNPATDGPALALEPLGGPTGATASAVAAGTSATAAWAASTATFGTLAPTANRLRSAPALPALATKAWVLADLDTGEVLAWHNPDLPGRPASTLKLLTALTVAPRLNPDQPYRAVKADEVAEGNRVVLYDGLTYKVKDLLHAALLPSANDAAQALARANGGIAATVEQMNAEAARLGATSTTARNPSGLDAEGQVTTARDLAAIGRAAMANPEIAEYLALTKVEFPGKRYGNGKRVIYPIYNHNRMLTDGFRGALGGKSGYTSKAGRTFVAAAERDGRRLLVSLLDIGGNTYTTAERLLTWGFVNAAELKPVGQLPQPSAPAPAYDRTIVPLVSASAPASRKDATAAASSDAPTGAIRTRSWIPSLPPLPRPSPLTVLTLLAAIIVALRARVYWIGCRDRPESTSLDLRPKAKSPRPRPLGGDDRISPAAESPKANDTADDDTRVDMTP